MITLALIIYKQTGRKSEAKSGEIQNIEMIIKKQALDPGV